jgi:hypothetical protein
MRNAWLALIVGATSASSIGAHAQDAPVVVELFTSQGCSSCPPADAFLTDLAQTRPDVLPLAFHVTYWDRLGWKDPFSLEAATARQESYARSLGDGQVYTPEMVVNGVYGFVGSRRNEGLAAVASAARVAAQRVPIRLMRDGPSLVVAIGRGAGHAAALLVGFDPQHQTNVGRGENGGRTLLESNIVRSMTPVGSWSGAEAEFRTPAPAGERFAALLQANDGRILGVALLNAPSP